MYASKGDNNNNKALIPKFWDWLWILKDYLWSARYILFFHFLQKKGKKKKKKEKKKTTYIVCIRVKSEQDC